MKMKLANKNYRPLFLALFGLAAVSQMAQAQLFTNINSDLCLTFRKVTPYTENNEVVVDIGQASNYLSAAIGTKMAVSQFSASQLVPGAFASLNNLSWAVFGYYSPLRTTSYNYYASYSNGITLWLTVPRTNNATPGIAPARQPTGIQSQTKTKITTLFSNAKYISNDIGIASAVNTPRFVSESIAAYPSRVVSVTMGSLENNAIGNLSDTWANNLEATTPGGFSGAVRSDLYMVQPSVDSSGNAILDPNSVNGLADYIGYFEFSSDGTMTFTREAANTTPVAPSPVALSIVASNQTRTISFLSSNSVTYQLCFTNATGLSAPVANWPALPATISGDGTTKSFQDTSAEPNRFYRVQER